MDKIYSWALRYQAAISMVLAMFAFAALVVLFPSNAKASEEFPDGMTFQTVQFGLACAEKDRMRMILLEEHGEVPIVAGAFTNGTVWLWYVNEENSTASFVVVKNEDQACLIFSGASDSDTALVPNMEPKWPAKEVGSGGDWNT
jgi:hypothetical protein